jgi:hypothetical protein
VPGPRHTVVGTYPRTSEVALRTDRTRSPTVSMINPTDRVEIIPSDQRRRSWTASEKIRIVEETFEPGMEACRNGVLRTSSSRDAGW